MGGMPTRHDQMGMIMVVKPITGTHNDTTLKEITTWRSHPWIPEQIFERSGGKYWNSETGQWDVTQNFEELKEKWNDPDATLMKTNYRLGPVKVGYDYLKDLSKKDASMYDLSPDFWLPLDDPNQKKKIIIQSPVNKRKKGGSININKAQQGDNTGHWYDEDVTDAVPVYGTIKSGARLYNDPSWGNFGDFVFSLGSDVLSATGVGLLTKGAKAAKAAKAVKAARSAKAVKRLNNDIKSNPENTHLWDNMYSTEMSDIENSFENSLYNAKNMETDGFNSIMGGEGSRQAYQLYKDKNKK